MGEMSELKRSSISGVPGNVDVLDFLVRFENRVMRQKRLVSKTEPKFRSFCPCTI